MRNPIVAKLAKALEPFAKDLNPDGSSAETGEAAKASQVETLASVYEQLGALIQQASQNGGSLPEGGDESVKTLAGTMLTVVGGQAEPAAEATPAPAEGAVPEQKRDFTEFGKRLAKALTPEVEAKVTMDYVRDKLWAVSDLLYKKELTQAKEGLQSMISSLDAAMQLVAATPAAEGGDAMAEKAQKSFKSEAEVAEWALAQLSVKDTDPVVAAKRYAAIAAVSKASVAKNWEQTGATPIKPLVVELASAFVSMPGTPMDVTVRSDQEDTGGGAGGAPPSNASSVNGADSNFAQNAVEVLGKAQAAVLSALSAEQPQSEAHYAAGGGTTSFAKNAPAPAATPAPAGNTEFAWPMDMADAARDEDGAKVRTSKVRTAKAAPKAADDSWGVDPWAKR